MIGHRFGHQSGQDGSSSQKLAILTMFCFVPRLFVVSKTHESSTNYVNSWCCQTKDIFSLRIDAPFSKQNIHAASLFSRKGILGAPIHRCHEQFIIIAYMIHLNVYSYQYAQYVQYVARYVQYVQYVEYVLHSMYSMCRMYLFHCMYRLYSTCTVRMYMYMYTYIYAYIYIYS